MLDVSMVSLIRFPAFFGNPDRVRKGCVDYFGTFEIRGAENIAHPERQHMVAIHPHGPTAFSRMHFCCGFRDLARNSIDI